MDIHSWQYVKLPVWGKPASLWLKILIQTLLQCKTLALDWIYACLICVQINQLNIHDDPTCFISETWKMISLIIFLSPEIITSSPYKQMFSMSFYLPRFAGSVVSKSLPSASEDYSYWGNLLKYRRSIQNIWGCLFLSHVQSI